MQKNSGGASCAEIRKNHLAAIFGHSLAMEGDIRQPIERYVRFQKIGVFCRGLEGVYLG